MKIANLVASIVYIFLLLISLVRGDASIPNKLLSSQDNPSSRPQEDIVCTKNLPYVWCLPNNYKRDIAPWEYRRLTNTSLPWNYHFDFAVRGVQEINERSQFIKLAMYSNGCVP